MDMERVERFEEIIRDDGRYPPEAYTFLHRGLEATTQMIFGEDDPPQPRHVTGQQYCEGLRRLALQQWGPLASEVLARWNIRSTRDFGEMVFLLVREGFMGKQDSDRVEDFDDAYDFESAFGSYEIQLDRDNE